MVNHGQSVMLPESLWSQSYYSNELLVPGIHQGIDPGATPFALRGKVPFFRYLYDPNVPWTPTLNIT